MNGQFIVHLRDMGLKAHVHVNLCPASVKKVAFPTENVGQLGYLITNE